ARVCIVTYLMARLREGMYTLKIPSLSHICPYPRFYLFRDFFRLANELLGSVFCDLGYCRLSRKPIPHTVLVQVRCGGRQAAQCVAKHCRRLPRQDASELDAPILDAPVGGGPRGR